MAFAPLRRTRLNQPSGDGIDWSNPITLGLVFAYNVAAGIEAVTGKPLHNTAGGARTLGLAGIATNPFYGYQNEPANSSDPLALRYDLTILTAAVFAKQDAVENANVIFCRGNGSSTPGWGIGLHGGSYNGPFFSVGTYTNLVPLGSGVTTDKYHLVTMSLDGSNLYGYWDGNAVLTTSYSGQAYQYGGGNRALIVGRNGQLQANQTHGALFLLWNRILSNKEHAVLGANPWQVFL